MKRVLTIANLYILCLALYNLMGVYGSTSARTLLVLVPAIMIAVYCIIKVFESNKSVFIQTLLFFVCLLIFYGIIRLIGGETLYVKTTMNGSTPQSFLIKFMHTMPAILVFYYYTKKGEIGSFYIIFWLFVYVIISYLQYKHAYEMFLQRMSEIGSSRTDMTNNAGYLFLNLIPLVVLLKKKPVVQYSIIGVIGFFVINSQKRGAILLFTICLLFILLSSIREKKSGAGRKITIAVLTIVTVIGFTELIQHMLETNERFYSRFVLLAEGDTNGRDVIFSSIWNYYINQYNIFQLLFGDGIESTLKYIGFFAHNDWLQLLMDCGMLGVISYAIYFSFFFKEIRKGRKIENKDLYLILTMCFIVSFGRTFFSMSYTDMQPTLALAIGYGFAELESVKMSRNKRITDYIHN